MASITLMIWLFWFTASRRLAPRTSYFRIVKMVMYWALHFEFWNIFGHPASWRGDVGSSLFARLATLNCLGLVLLWPHLFPYRNSQNCCFIDERNKHSLRIPVTVNLIFKNHSLNSPSFNYPFHYFCESNSCNPP